MHISKEELRELLIKSFNYGLNYNANFDYPDIKYANAILEEYEYLKQTK
jgi:hypothetical protein